jgi:CRP-like cAMP-binding protein
VEVVAPARVIADFGFSRLRSLATFGALPDEMIEALLVGGRIFSYRRGEYLARYGEPATSFHVVLRGCFAFYKHCGDHDVLTRYFHAGDQSGFDLMIGLISHNGTDVAQEDSLLLEISREHFHAVQREYPGAFGLLMINLARELSREIEMLEGVIAESTGWLGRS